MKKGMPKITLGFFKDGLRINSKQFHPLNMSVNGISMESDKKFKSIDPMELFETFETLKVDDATKPEKIKTLKTMLQKLEL